VSSGDDFRTAADLRSALRRFDRRSEKVARRHGLTPRQYQLLLMIKGAADGTERSRVSDLVVRLQLTQSTVTELVQRAEEAGLIERRPSPADGRVVDLTLSGEGNRRLQEAWRELGPELAGLQAVLEQQPQPLR
jgi:DNA-binding MarR family transcriptional regulator